MKQLITAIPTLLLLCGSVAMQAQTGNTLTQYKQVRKHNTALIRAIESQQQARLDAAKGAVARTTGISERLIAFGEHGINALYDTNRYVYSGNRSSSYDFNNMQYYIYPGQINDGYPMGICSGNGVDEAAAHTNGVLCDSVLTYASSNPFTLTALWSGAYDNNNNLIEFTNSFDDKNTITTFDANQRPKTVLYMSWNNNSNAWDTASRRYFTFSGNQLVSDSTAGYQNGTWSPLSMWSYNYNNNNNPTQAEDFTYNAGWVPQELYELSYNTDNLLVRDSVMLFSNGSWQPVENDSMGYTAGVNYTTYNYQSYYYDGMPSGLLVNMKHISGGLPDTVYYYSYNVVSFDTLAATTIYYTYDNYGNPTAGFEYDLNLTTGNYGTTPDYIFNYYYDTFTTTAVSNVTKQDVDIKVYPNPAASEINISMTGIQQGALTYITVVNALGQTVHTESLPWMSTTQTISTAGLKAGNYWLIVQDKTGNALGRQEIVKE